MAPTIIFVPGFWEGPTVFDAVVEKLKAAGFTTAAATLPSTGTKSPNNPGMKDDIAAVRKTIAPVVEGGADVVIVAHSAGGFLSGAAIEGLEASKRKAAGQTGGVSKIVLLAGGILPEGTMHPDLPFADYNEDGSMTCKSPRELLFHDVPDADRWLAQLSHQPAKGWNDAVPYAGWQHVPCVYVVAKNDKLLPVELQQQLIGLAQAELEELDSGHMLPLTKPDEVAAIVQKAAAA